MQHLQEVFGRIQEASEEKRTLKNLYKDTLTNLAEYKDVNEQIRNLQIKKKQIENTIQQQLSGEFTKLEALEAAIKNDFILMSDLALNHLVKGEQVAVTDRENNNYEPIFNVKFKKVK